MSDADGDGKAERREVFAHGFGHHIAYAGHDMHGLTAGPDGKIYWTIGDKGISVTTPEGQTFSYPNEGGVLRANPDGSGFEVFAHGLRNVQELAFDEFGNLFGVDNDSDQPGEKERFVYIVEGMDAGWRCSYQYRGKDYNPWTAEHLWKPRREEQPAYLLPPLSNYVDGPCGFTYNPGTALDASWQRTFFLTEAPGGKQWAFQVEPDGPAFCMTNSRQIGAGIAFTGWKFGPDGALYGADWGATAYPMDQKGAVWTIDVPVAQRSPQREETRQLLGSRWAETNETKLQGLLGHADQRVRLKTQFEIVRRNAPTLLQTVLAAPDAPRLARIHALWGLGQLRDSAAIASTLADSDPAIRAQAAKTLGQIPLPVTPSFDLGRLASLLRDADPQVRFHTAMALGNLGTPGSPVLPAVLEFIDSEPDHPYFRLAQSRALGAVATTDALARLAEDSSPAQRLVAVLALRERRAPEIARFLSDATPAVRDEAALAIHDGDSIPEAIPALAASLAAPGDHAERFIRRAINANFRVGTPEAAGRVALYALLPDAPAPLRAEALNALLAWLSPPPLDRVDGWRRHLDSRDPQSIGAALTKPVNQLLDSPENDVLEKAVQLASSLQIPLDPARLDALLHNEAAPAGVRVAALENIKSAPAIAYSLASTAADLRIRGAALLASSDPEAARPYLAETLQRKDATIAERQAAFALLAELKAEDVLKPWADRLTTGDLPPALWLDVAEAAAKVGLTATFTRPAADPLSAWIECLEGGDPARGEDIFRNNIAAQCVACHKADDSKGGSLIGPNVKSVGLRDRRYLLESLTLPQAAIAKGYGSITLTLTDGSVTGGQLRGETAKGIELRDPANHGSQVIPLEKIRERGAVISLMPPMGLILPKRDVRDLVAYLSTLRAK